MRASISATDAIIAPFPTAAKAATGGAARPPPPPCRRPPAASLGRGAKQVPRPPVLLLHAAVLSAQGRAEQG